MSSRALVRVIAAALVLVALSACEPEKQRPSGPPPPPPVPRADITASEINKLPGMTGDIAFISVDEVEGSFESNNRDVFLLAADGSAVTRVTRDVFPEREPVIAPDGSTIYFVCEDRKMICRRNPDGSAAEIVFQDPTFRLVQSPAISFDGKELLFVGMFGGDATGLGTKTELFRYDIASGERRVVDVDTNDARRGVSEPTWTPQGGIVFSKGELTLSFLYHLPPGATEPISLQPLASDDPFAINSAATGDNPDVSSDGTKIVYETNKVITSSSGPMHDTNESIFTMNLDGTGVREIAPVGHDPAWSPDGSRVAFQKHFFDQDLNRRGSDIFVVGADGTGEARLTTSNFTEKDLDWGDVKVTVSVGNVTQPEGDTDTKFSFQVELSGPSDQQVTVLYRTVNGSAIAGSDYDAKATDALVFAPGETTKTVDVSIEGDDEPETNESFYLELSNPSGAVLGKARGRGLIVNDDVPVAPTPSISPSPSPSTSPPPVTISNGRIAFASSRSGAQQIYTMEPNGTDVEVVGTDQSSSTLGDPSWSSDAARLIYTALNGAQLEIVDRPADGTGSFRPLALDSNVDTEPVYFRGPSTDGFIWASDRDGDFELYYSPLSGGTPKKLTDNTFEDRSPSVSGDGRYVVYHSNADGDFDIYRLQVSATGDPVGSPENLTQETGAPTTERNPDYALTENKITYQGNEHGDLDVFVLDIDTRQELHVTTDVADETFPSLSPDGAQVAYAKAGDIYVQSAAEGAAATKITNTGDNGSPDWGPRLGAQTAARASHEQLETSLRYAMLPASALLAGLIVRRRRRAQFEGAARGLVQAGALSKR